MSARVRSWLLAVGAASIVGVLALNVWRPLPGLEEGWGWATGQMAYPVAAALLLARRPGNVIGRILALVGVAAGAIFTLSWYAATYPQGPLSAHASALGSVAVQAQFAGVIALLHLFPSGQPLNRRHAGVFTVFVWWAAVTAVAILLQPGPLPFDWTGRPNPFGVGPTWLPSLVQVGGFGLPVFALLGLWALLARRRRAGPVERAQLRWFFTGGGLVLAMVIVIMAYPEETSPFVETLIGLIVVAAFWSLPTAIVIAITHYRLYDIDVLISKTVVFAGLAGFITVVYVAIVVGVGSLVGAGDEPNLGLSILATAVVAVAFQPVRERLTRLANRLVYGQRATPYEVLSRFSARVGETVATEQTLAHMARLLAEGTGAVRAQVWLKVDERMRAAASWPQEAVPELAAVVNSDGSLPEFAEVDQAVPVSHDGQLLGALTVTKKRGEPVTPTERSLVDDLAGQAGLVLRNVGLTADLRARLEELRDSRRRLVEAQDGERRRLERDLHDGAQQQLVALKIKLGVAKRLAERDGATQAAALVDQLTEETDEAVAALRELAHGIYPPLLAAEGLAGALRARGAKAPIPVVVEAKEVGRYSQEVEAAVYFCVLEAIQNAVKYARASQVVVRLAQVDGQLTFEVADDGIGFDPTTTPKGHGLTNMTDRLHALDGKLQVNSSPRSGTKITGHLPILSTTQQVLT